MTDIIRWWIQSCSKCNGWLASPVKPRYGDAYECASADAITRLRAEKAELVEAADALLTRTDFWRNVNVAIPGEYDDLSEAVARVQSDPHNKGQRA